MSYFVTLSDGKTREFGSEAMANQALKNAESQGYTGSIKTDYSGDIYIGERVAYSPEVERSYNPVGSSASVVDVVKNQIENLKPFGGDKVDLPNLEYYENLLKPMTDMFNNYDELNPKGYNQNNLPNMPNNTLTGNAVEAIKSAGGDFLYIIAGAFLVLLLVLRK